MYEKVKKKSKTSREENDRKKINETGIEGGVSRRRRRRRKRREKSAVLRTQNENAFYLFPIA